jgi:hypothetical protein
MKGAGWLRVFFHTLNVCMGLALLVNVVAIGVAVWQLHRSAVLLIAGGVSLVNLVAFVTFQIIMWYNRVFFKKAFHVLVLFLTVVQSMIYILLLAYIPLHAHLVEYFTYVVTLEPVLAFVFWTVLGAGAIFFGLACIYFFQFIKTWSEVFNDYARRENEAEAEARQKAETKDPEEDHDHKDVPEGRKVDPDPKEHPDLKLLPQEVPQPTVQQRPETYGFVATVQPYTDPRLVPPTGTYQPTYGQQPPVVPDTAPNTVVFNQYPDLK